MGGDLVGYVGAAVRRRQHVALREYVFDHALLRGTKIVQAEEILKMLAQVRHAVARGGHAVLHVGERRIDLVRDARDHLAERRHQLRRLIVVLFGRCVLESRRALRQDIVGGEGALRVQFALGNDLDVVADDVRHLAAVVLDR